MISKECGRYTTRRRGTAVKNEVGGRFIKIAILYTEPKTTCSAIRVIVKSNMTAISGNLRDFLIMRFDFIHVPAIDIPPAIPTLTTNTKPPKEKDEDNSE